MESGDSRKVPRDVITLPYARLTPGRWLRITHKRRSIPPGRIREIQLPKRSGGFRTVFVPDRRLRFHLRHVAKRLGRFVSRVMAHRVVYGRNITPFARRIRTNAGPRCESHLVRLIDAVAAFLPGRDPVYAAGTHLALDWTVQMDIKNCFDSIEEWVAAKLVDHIDDSLDDLKREAKCLAQYRCFFVDGHLPQGYPTSPILSNLFLMGLDTLIVDRLMELFGYSYGTMTPSKPFLYTRYADDLIISLDDKGLIDDVVKAISECLKAAHLETSDEKLSIQGGKNRRRILGVMVDKTGVYPPRSTLRRLRRLQTRDKRRGVKSAQTQGLESWVAHIRAVNEAIRRQISDEVIGALR